MNPVVLDERDLEAAEFIAKHCNSTLDEDIDYYQSRYNDPLDPYESDTKESSCTEETIELEDKDLSKEDLIDLITRNDLKDYRIIEKDGELSISLILNVVKEGKFEDSGESKRDQNNDQYKEEFESEIVFKKAFSGKTNIIIKQIFRFDEFIKMRAKMSVEDVIRDKMTQKEGKRWVKLNLHKLA